MSDKADVKPGALNDWFITLDDGRRRALLDDKWMLADAAYHAGADAMQATIAEQAREIETLTQYVEQQDDAYSLLGLDAGRKMDELERELAALKQPISDERVPECEDWSVFVGYLIDKCEGHTVAEESLQDWMAEMIADPHYGALFRREKTADGKLVSLNAPIVMAIEAAEEEHGSLRAAAKELGIDAGYLSRLKSGEKLNPGGDVLSALGLERVTMYRARLGNAVVMPDNLLSHRGSWISALERLVVMEPESAPGEVDDKSYWLHELQAMRDMYTDLDRLKPSRGVPEGYRLAPVEPTDKMLRALHSHHTFTVHGEIANYKAMLSAAPSPAIEPAHGDDVSVPRELLLEAIAVLMLYTRGSASREGILINDLRALLAGGAK